MNQTDEREGREREDYRRKRVKRLKTIIVIVAIVILIIPMMLCTGMMLRLNKMQKQIDSLTGEKTEAYHEGKQQGDPSDVAFAKETEKYASGEEKENIQKGKGAKEAISDNVVDSSAKGENVLTEEEQLELANKKKKVYLTFDDGPGKYTAELLDTLRKYDVKATFFVIGKTDTESKKMYQRIVQDGHTLGMHSYSHQYGKIYQSIRAFDEDFRKISDLLYEVTGVRSQYYRFPGGSSNLVSERPMTEFIEYLNQQDVHYYDWNAINGDATGKNFTVQEMVDNVMSSVEKNNNSIVLMHDTASKDTTIQSLPVLIKRLRHEGYILLPISEYTNPIQHVKTDKGKG